MITNVARVVTAPVETTASVDSEGGDAILSDVVFEWRMALFVAVAHLAFRSWAMKRIGTRPSIAACTMDICAACFHSFALVAAYTMDAVWLHYVRVPCAIAITCVYYGMVYRHAVPGQDGMWMLCRCISNWMCCVGLFAIWYYTARVLCLYGYHGSAATSDMISSVGITVMSHWHSALPPPWTLVRKDVHKDE